MNFRLSLLKNSHGRHPDLTGGDTEGGPRPTLRWTKNWRGLVGWALAYLQSRSRRVLQDARLRVELLSGESYAHILNPGEDSWRIPEASAGGVSSFLREAQKATVEGVRHFLNGWVHLAFLLVLCLLGGAQCPPPGHGA